MIKSIRTKLTLWYTVIMTLVLVAFSIAIYSMIKHKLRDQYDSNILSASLTIDASMEDEWDDKNSATANVNHLLQELHIPSLAIAIYKGTGKMIAAKPDSPGSSNILPLNMPRKWFPKDREKLLTQNLRYNGHKEKWRIAVRRIRLEKAKTDLLVVVSRTMTAISRQMVLLRRILWLVVPIVILLAGLGGWLFAWKLLSPVSAMTERAKQLYTENIHERLPVYNPRDEIGRLAVTLNEFLHRAQNALEQERRFMADASHELRTPLFVVRSAADVVLEKPRRQEAEYRDALMIIRQQARRMSRMVEDLFFLSCADGQGLPTNPVDFYLDELVSETVRATRVLADKKAVQMELTAAGEIPFHGDEALLRQMLLNLLDNAVKFTPASGNVRVEICKRENAIEISVHDSGPGIAVDEQMQIFGRFFRSDKARTRSESVVGSGAGLGLPIARWIAESHGGRLELRHSDSSGSTFVARLPMKEIV